MGKELMNKKDIKIIERLMKADGEESITESFPCGYSYTIKIKGRRFEDTENLLLEKCPMHGNKCELKIVRVTKQ